MLLRTFIAATLLVAGMQTALAQTRDQLVAKYSALAGSEDNARTLVNGLRDGAEFTIDGTLFRAPGGKMRNGEVNIALSIVQKQLRKAKPTARELHAALVGTPGKPGVLMLRAEHKGWGDIADACGLTLAEVARP